MLSCCYEHCSFLCDTWWFGLVRDFKIQTSQNIVRSFNDVGRIYWSFGSLNNTLSFSSFWFQPLHHSNSMDSDAEVFYIFNSIVLPSSFQQKTHLSRREFSVLRWWVMFFFLLFRGQISVPARAKSQPY